MNNNARAFLYAGITVFFWSTVASAFKIALKLQNILQVLFVATLTSLVVFGVGLLISGKYRLLRLIKAKDLALSALLGLLNPFAYYLFIFKSYSLLPAQIAQPANFIWPIVLSLLSVPLLNKPFTKKSMMGIIISFTGVIILSFRTGEGNFAINLSGGLALALSSSLIWALYWLINVKDKRDDIVKLFLGFSFAMVYLFPVAVFSDNMPSFHFGTLSPAIYIGLFEMGISFILWLKALQNSESTTKISNLIYITPFLSLVFIHFILHEQIMLTSLIGLCFIVTGNILAYIKKEQQ